MHEVVGFFSLTGVGGRRGGRSVDRGSEVQGRLHVNGPSGGPSSGIAPGVLMSQGLQTAAFVLPQKSKPFLTDQTFHLQ